MGMFSNKVSYRYLKRNINNFPKNKKKKIIF